MLLTSLLLTVSVAAYSTFYFNATTDLQDIVEPTIECIDKLTNNATVAVAHMCGGGYAFTVVGEESKFGNITHIDELQDCIDLYSESGLAYTLNPIDESEMKSLMRLRIGGTEVLIETEHPENEPIQETNTTSRSEPLPPWSTFLPIFANDISAQKQIHSMH